MTLPFRLLFLFLALSGVAGAQLPSFGATKPKHIGAELISEQSTIAPGKPFRVLVKLELEEHWHTYGKTVAEGVTGKPTTLIWTLPDGWKTSDLPWPPTVDAPSAGGTTTPAYEGTVYLPVLLTPPADLATDSPTKIAVKVDAIVCNLENCVPVRDLKASLELKTAAEPVTDPAQEELFKKALPTPETAPAPAPTSPPKPEPLPAAAPAPPSLSVKKLSATLISEQSTIAPGKPFSVAVRVEIAKGFHIYSQKARQDEQPTTLEWKLPEGWKVTALAWPETREVPNPTGGTVPAYEGTVYLPAQLTPPTTLKPGQTESISVKLGAVVCDESSCEAVRGAEPKLQLKVADTPVADESTASIFKDIAAVGSSDSGSAATPPEKQSLALSLLFAFIGGLILNIMPCVFPVLALKVTSVVNQAHNDKGRVLLHGIAYTLGVLICLWTLDGILIAVNAGGGQKGWGYQFQEPWFVFGVVLIMLVFGLNMAGLFEVGTSAVGVGDQLTAKSGLSGSFFGGLFATVVATPCTAPFLASALTFALSLPALGSLGVFTCIGLGLASPYLVLGLFPSLLKFLPRPGVWMESFKQAMAFPMLGAAAYFTWVLLRLVSGENGRNILFSLVIIAMACWIYGRWSVLSKPTAVRVRAIVIAAAFFLLGIWLADPKLEVMASDKIIPGVVSWKPWSPELVVSLRQEKKPVYIDFTADWCGTCQFNHRVYSDASLADDFNNRGVTLLKADWTKPDERIEKALAALNESAIPVNILYVPGRNKPVVLPKTLTVSNVKAALAELDKK